MPVSYKLIRSRRKTMSIKIIDNEVYVYAPLYLPQSEIDRQILQHQGWIEKKLANPRINLNFNLEEDEFLYVLGKQYKKQIVIQNKKEILLTDDTIILSGRTLNSIDRNFREYLKNIVDERFQAVTSYLGIDCNVQYKIYRSKWGCCYQERNLIILNYLLGCTPQMCIDEVICHELTHFKVSNHQKEFYHELEKICPDYKTAVKKLKEYAI